MSDARGGVRLVIDGVTGVTGIVESMHQRIARLSPPLGTVTDTPTRGITGLVYRSIRGTTGLVGKALETALAGIEPLLNTAAPEGSTPEAAPTRNAIVSALNGVLGDHLERTANPLAITMELRVRAPAPPGPRVLLLVHGLCMNDEQWTREGHDHGQALAGQLNCTPVYARYNTGRHISRNGQDLATALEQLLQTWPVALESVSVIGHSMGGLVARSALHHAAQAGMAWPALVRKLVFLGSPHHGAPLERGGNWLHRGLAISPYVAPFTRLTGLRSEGITDLRHGNLVEADWTVGRFGSRDTRQVVPLPAGVDCYALAGTLGKSTGDEWIGDGLVPLASALGRHARPTRDLRIPPSHCFTASGVNHMALLSSPVVYQRLLRWLKVSRTG